MVELFDVDARTVSAPVRNVYNSTRSRTRDKCPETPYRSLRGGFCLLAEVGRTRQNVTLRLGSSVRDRYFSCFLALIVNGFLL